MIRWIRRKFKPRHLLILVVLGDAVTVFAAFMDGGGHVTAVELNVQCFTTLMLCVVAWLLEYSRDVWRDLADKWRRLFEQVDKKRPVHLIGLTDKQLEAIQDAEVVLAQQWADVEQGTLG